MKVESLSGFSRRLRREWRVLHLPSSGKTAILAVSGGADSAALLAACAELKTAKKLDLNFIVAHFNHCLRGEESDADALFVEELAAQFKFEFAGGEWNQDVKPGDLRENLEQAARNARYNFLLKKAEESNAFAVLTGHTLNDQAETFLLRLIRGSGLDGLAAIRTVRDADSLKGFEGTTAAHNLQLIRPLLNWATREKTEDYCRVCGIDFRIDSMNKDASFTRVRVRRELLPLMKTFNPKIVEQLALTARLVGEDSDELNVAAEKLLEKALIDLALDANFLKEFSESMRRRVIRLWLERLRGSLRKLEAVHLIALGRLLTQSDGGSFVELPGGGIVIKKGGMLVLEQRKG